jgi:hypothetical protein
MGVGIMGAIPVSFCFTRSRYESEADRYKKEFSEHAAKDFFDFYNEETREDRNGKEIPYYVIKTEVLLPQFKDFFFEFNRLIGEEKILENCEKFNEAYEKLIASNDLEQFMNHFDNDNAYDPIEFSYFSALHVEHSRNLLIYRGSYKAFLEEYSTFNHMEKMLVAAMKNPLAKVVRFGMSL